MSKRKKRQKSAAITNTLPAPAPKRPTSAAITTPPPTPRPAAPGLVARLALFGLAVAVLLLAGGLYARQEKIWPFRSESTERDVPLWDFSGGPPRGTRNKAALRPRSLFDALMQGRSPAPAVRWKPEPWEPATKEDRLVDRFVRLHKDKLADAVKLLSPLPASDRPLDDAQFDALATDYFLRSPQLKIVDVWKGDLGADGTPRPAKGRYILVTKGNVSSPPLRLRNAAGGDSPSQLNMTSPDLVIEVKEGAIRGLRAESHKAP